jgi:predicted ATPase
MPDTHRVTAIRVQGFQSIAKLDLTLHPLNVLIDPD